MIKIKSNRNSGLTTSLIDRVITDSKCILVVPTFSTQSCVNTVAHDVMTDYGTKEVPREVIEDVRSRIVVSYEFLSMPPIPVKEGYTYLVDEGSKPSDCIRIMAMFEENGVDYELYYGHYPRPMY